VKKYLKPGIEKHVGEYFVIKQIGSINYSDYRWYAIWNLKWFWKILYGYIIEKHANYSMQVSLVLKRVPKSHILRNLNSHILAYSCYARFICLDCISGNNLNNIKHSKVW